MALIPPCNHFDHPPKHTHERLHDLFLVCFVNMNFIISYIYKTYFYQSQKKKNDTEAFQLFSKWRFYMKTHQMISLYMVVPYLRENQILAEKSTFIIVIFSLRNLSLDIHLYLQPHSKNNYFLYLYTNILLAYRIRATY